MHWTAMTSSDGRHGGTKADEGEEWGGADLGVSVQIGGLGKTSLTGSRRLRTVGWEGASQADSGVARPRQEEVHVWRLQVCEDL